jgi:hypothetical protein
MRRVMIADTRCTELLGRGDVLRPWSMDAAELSSVPIEADWRVADQPAKFVVLELRLSHRTLGEIVGARRPTVTSALGQLREEAKLRPLDDGTWLLLGQAPTFDEPHP